MTSSYTLTVRSEHPIPPDVLVEHIAVCLKSLNFTGKVDITMNSYATTDEITPFSNPDNVVFDDVVKAEPYTGPLPAGGITDVQVSLFHPDEHGVKLPQDPYPLTSRAVDFLRNLRRNG